MDMNAQIDEKMKAEERARYDAGLPRLATGLGNPCVTPYFQNNKVEIYKVRNGFIIADGGKEAAYNHNAMIIAGTPEMAAEKALEVINSWNPTFLKPTTNE